MNRYRVNRNIRDFVEYRKFCDEVEQKSDGELLTVKSRNVIVQTPELDTILQKIRYTVNRSRINIYKVLIALKEDSLQVLNFIELYQLF